MFDSVETGAGNSAMRGTDTAANSAAASNVSRTSNSGAAQSSNAMGSLEPSNAVESLEHLLLERDQPARAFRSVAGVDSNGSAASMLEPRDRNSSATEFRSSSGTDLQVCCVCICLLPNLSCSPSASSGSHELNQCQRAHQHRQLRFSHFSCFNLVRGRGCPRAVRCICRQQTAADRGRTPAATRTQLQAT